MDSHECFSDFSAFEAYQETSCQTSITEYSMEQHFFRQKKSEFVRKRSQFTRITLRRRNCTRKLCTMQQEPRRKTANWVEKLRIYWGKNSTATRLYLYLLSKILQLCLHCKNLQQLFKHSAKPRVCEKLMRSLRFGDFKENSEGILWIVVHV